MKRTTLGVSIGFFILSAITFLVRMFISTSIDASGILHEPFYLIILGYIFLFMGMINFLIYLVIRYVKRLR